MISIEAIKAAIRCDEYAARFLTVRNGVALCPFHKEKTPSFRLHPQFFKCFGCGVSGDVITFSHLYHGISKGEAIRQLAEETGISLTPTVKLSPYEALKQERLRTEAAEWKRLLRTTLIQSLHNDDFSRVLPFVQAFEAMTTSQLFSLYTLQRTTQQASMLRSSAKEHAKPTVEKLLWEFLQWSR